MLMAVVLVTLLVSFIFIWKGTDWITDSLIPVAKKLGTNYIAITTLLVAFMLSVPVLFVSVYLFLQGHVESTLRVIIGAVMGNIGLTIGLSAVLKPLNIDRRIAIRDGMFLVVVTIVVLFLGSDLAYTRSEGIILLLLFVPYALNVWFFEKWRSEKSKKQKVKQMEKSLKLFEIFSRIKLKASSSTLILGAIVVIIGSFLFSYSLIELNRVLHLSGFLIGFTLGAIGAIFPNIAAAIQGTRKGYRDFAITETFGSNNFILLITLGIVILLNPFTIAPRTFYFDLTWVIMIHFLLLALIFKSYKYKKDSITRYEGLVLLLFYIALLVVHGIWF